MRPQMTGSERSRTRDPLPVLIVLGAAAVAIASNRIASSEGAVQPRVVIALSLLVITCGQIVLWPRRDNIFAYRQAGAYFTTLFIPLVGTAALTDSDTHILDLYARLLAVGAVFFAAGLALGGHFAAKTRPRLTFTFGQSLRTDSPAWTLVRRHTRMLAAAAVVALALAFALLRYVPLLAADRQLAKYGIGVYGAGFARSRLVYHFALALAGVILPMAIVVAYRSRALLDIALCGAVAAGLVASLSRGDAFAGPILVVIAVAIARRVAPLLIVAGVCLVYFAGALSNELLFPSVAAQPTLSARLAASAPDVRDHLSFLKGFEREGSEETKGRTLVAKLGAGGKEYDPVDYALRLVTGVPDPSALASGGIRLPAPLWGFSSFGFPGAAAFCLISGLFIGWGTVRVRNVVTARRSDPDYAVNLLLAALFLDGTFACFGAFFFAPFGDLVVLVAALMIGVIPLARLRRQPGPDDAMVPAAA